MKFQMEELSIVKWDFSILKFPFFLKAFLCTFNTCSIIWIEWILVVTFVPLKPYKSVQICKIVYFNRFNAHARMGKKSFSNIFFPLSFWYLIGFFFSAISNDSNWLFLLQFKATKSTQNRIHLLKLMKFREKKKC